MTRLEAPTDKERSAVRRVLYRNLLISSVIAIAIYGGLGLVDRSFHAFPAWLASAWFGMAYVFTATSAESLSRASVEMFRTDMIDKNIGATSTLAMCKPSYALGFSIIAPAVVLIGLAVVLPMPQNFKPYAISILGVIIIACCLLIAYEYQRRLRIQIGSDGITVGTRSKVQEFTWGEVASLMIWREYTVLGRPSVARLAIETHAKGLELITVRLTDFTDSEREAVETLIRETFSSCGVRWISLPYRKEPVSPYEIRGMYKELLEKVAD